jgi:hypothetical protein
LERRSPLKAHRDFRSHRLYGGTISRHRNLHRKTMRSGATVLATETAAGFAPKMESMSNVIDLDRRGNNEAPALVDRFIQLSGARLCDPIIIAGAAHLEHLIALTRRGFAQVSCQSPDRSPHIPNSQADAIFAPSVANEAQFLSLLDGLGSRLRPGGALIVAATDLAGDARDAALRAHGFGALEPMGDGLWRARKRPLPMVRAA